MQVHTCSDTRTQKQTDRDRLADTDNSMPPNIYVNNMKYILKATKQLITRNSNHISKNQITLYKLKKEKIIMLTIIWVGSLGVRFEVGGKITPPPA